MYVTLMDSEYNRSKGVVDKVGVMRYLNHTLGTLVELRDEPGTWMYYFKGKEEFEEVDIQIFKRGM